MIVSENITLNIKKPFDNTVIETALLKKGIEPLRWSIVDIGEDTLTLNVSYVNEN